MSPEQRDALEKKVTRVLEVPRPVATDRLKQRCGSAAAQAAQELKKEFKSNR